MNLTTLLRFLLLVIVAALACCHLLIVSAFPYLNHDVAQYISAGQILAEGGLPYVDVVDTNPPMILYLGGMSGLIARLIPLPLAVTGLCFWTGLVFGLLVFIAWMSRKTIPGLNQEELLFALAIWILASLLIYLESNYAQRDQIVFLFLTPFVLARFGRYNGTIPRASGLVAASVLAAIGIAMKPVYILTLLVSDATLAIWYRRLETRLRYVEVYLFVSLVILLLIHPFLIPPMAAPSLYWTIRIIRSYHTYNSSFSETMDALLVGNAKISLLILISLCTLGIIKRGNRAFRPSLLFGFAGLANAGVAVIQMKGWIYHSVPLLLSSAFSASFLIPVLSCIRSNVTRLVLYLVTILILFAVVIEPYMDYILATTRSGPLTAFPENEVTSLVKTLANPSDRVMVLDTGVGGAYPALTYSGRRPAGRFLSAFPVAFFSAGSRDYVPRSDLLEDARRYYTMLLEDVERDRPALILILAKPGATALPKDFRISEYLRRQGFYEFLHSNYMQIGTCREFDVLLRAVETSPKSSNSSPERNPDLLAKLIFLRDSRVLSPIRDENAVAP